MALKAVLFDLWETLVTDAPDLQRARQLWRVANVRAVLEADGVHADSDELDAAIIATSLKLTAMHNTGVDVDAAGRVGLFVGEWHQRGGAELHERTFEALQTAICTMTPGLYPRLQSGAAECLAAVRAQGLKTALVSNAGITTAPTLREMLVYYGLAPHLDALVFSDEMQLAKPSAAMFTAALDAISVAGEEAAFVGDSALHDVAGAQPLGLFAIQIGGHDVAGIVPDARVKDLDEVASVLADRDPSLLSLDRAGG